MSDTPAWLARYGLPPGTWMTAAQEVDAAKPDAIACRAYMLVASCAAEIQRLNDRIAVLESGQREMETRLPTEGGS